MSGTENGSSMAPNPNLNRLHEAGVSIWLDTLSRELLRQRRVRRADPRLQRHGRDVQSDDLRQGDHRLGPATTRSCGELAAAASVTARSCSSRWRSTTCARPPACCGRPTSESGGRDGFISFECTPDLADDTGATISQATNLWQRLGQPNVMIKVPGTAAGTARD